MLAGYQGWFVAFLMNHSVDLVGAFLVPWLFSYDFLVVYLV
jgi:hypothetical protein